MLLEIFDFGHGYPAAVDAPLDPLHAQRRGLGRRAAQILQQQLPSRSSCTWHSTPRHRHTVVTYHTASHAVAGTGMTWHPSSTSVKPSAGSSLRSRSQTSSADASGLAG
ncbi:hypothetical protein [Nonomuraea recticatena]|uniref:hypothetical protein n=1 Tax=Nonomuraea recticatena TaxID=46178 RepID=UPI00361ECD32